MANSTKPALVVFAWGNASRGDDGIGPRIADRLRKLARSRVELIEDHQLNIEHVTDIPDDVPLLFIDASVAIEHGFGVQRLAPSDDGNFSTHAISPAALLNVYRETMQRPAPEAFLLHIAGRYFELGDDLSSEADDALSAAWDFLKSILKLPETEWPKRLAKAVT